MPGVDGQLVRYERPLICRAGLPRRSAASATLCLVFLLGSRASAEGPPSCPDAEALRAALSALAGDEQSRAAFADVERADLKLEDLGDRFRVTVKGRSREYSDPGRDCKARAKLAAVFTALVLSPTSEEDSGRSPESVPPQAAQPPPATPPPQPPRIAAIRNAAHRFDVRAGASYSLGFAGDGAPHAAGVLLRGTYAPSAWGIELGVLLPASSATLSVGAARAELLRYPIDISARLGFAAGPLGVDLDAGAMVSVLRLRDVSDGGRPAVTRFEPALRLGAGLRLREPRVSPAAGILWSLIPVRYPLALEPTGVLARAPTVWLGGWVGLSAAFD